MVRQRKTVIEKQILRLPPISRDMIENSPLAMAAVEGKNHLVRCASPAFCRFLGKEREELIGYPLAKAFPEGNGCISLLNRVYRTGKSGSLAEQKRFGPNLAYWSFAAWAVFDADRHPIGLFIHVADITETAVFRSEVTAINQELMIGSVRQHEMTEAAEGLNAELHREIIERRSMEEELHRSHDELERRVQERTAELAGANKELQQEIAQREKAEQQLRQAQKMEAIGTLTGGIAHDLNNILAPIIINSEMALLDFSGDSRIREELELIRKSGLRGKELVRQLLLFSRKSEQKPQILALAPLVKETFQLMRSSIPSTIEMRLSPEIDSDLVNGDPSQIQQVIINLCVNAAYAMRGTTGIIDISLRGVRLGETDLPEADMRPDNYLVLSVGDTGCGMEPLVRNRIFEPFFTTKPPGEGTGLGLSVVHGIVKSHKGGITVSSEPGKGSVFTVYFPKIDTAGSVEAQPFASIPTGNERILLVDDEEFTTRAVDRMLQRLGYRVTALMDSREALGLFSADPSQFDLVIADQTMPFLTGEDLGKEMMRIRTDIPIILCTGYSDLISSEKAAGMGFRGFIMKPFTLRECAELVRNVLDQKRSG